MIPTIPYLKNSREKVWLDMKKLEHYLERRSLEVERLKASLEMLKALYERH